jgi:hypothetical protein
MERERGFEPPAACLEGRYSTSLSYSQSIVPFFVRNPADTRLTFWGRRGGEAKVLQGSG